MAVFIYTEAGRQKGVHPLPAFIQVFPFFFIYYLLLINYIYIILKVIYNKNILILFY